MKKIWFLYFVVAFLIYSTGYLLVDKFQSEKFAELTPNRNFSYATGPNIYQWLADAFVFVIKRPANVSVWEYGNGEYALLVIERGNGKIICPAFSGLSIVGSDIDLEPFVGKAVLVTGFNRTDNEQSGSVYIEKLELDSVVNDRIEEYREVCPFPFRKLSEAAGF